MLVISVCKICIYKVIIVFTCEKNIYNQHER
jgi:hypothetical protein